MTRVALITGASEGIGKAIAIYLAVRGIDPILVSRSQDKLNAAVEEIRQAAPKSNPYTIAADIGNVQEVKRVVNEACNKYGHIDILVNNAGIYDLDLITNLSAERLAAGIDTNLKGAVTITREMISKFRGKGTIVDILSTAALEKFDQNNIYGPGKWAHRFFSETVERENPGLTVYRVYPSNTRTAGRKVAHSELEKQIEREGYFLSAEDIAKEVYNLLEGKYITHDLVITATKEGKVLQSATSSYRTDYKRIN